jgi:hypothetical protein
MRLAAFVKGKNDYRHIELIISAGVSRKIITKLPPLIMIRAGELDEKLIIETVRGLENRINRV